VAILAKLCLPDPPTPNINAFPWGWRIILAILVTCSVASKNITNFIGVLGPAMMKEISLLYSY